jgi:hypothetical protein
MFGGPEGLLNRPKLLVAQHGLKRVEIGVSAQHEDAIEPRVVLDLGLIDGEVVLADRLEVMVVTGIADWRLVALGELTLPRGANGGSVDRVLLSLLMICGRRCSVYRPGSRPLFRNRPACRFCRS